VSRKPDWLLRALAPVPRGRSAHSRNLLSIAPRALNPCIADRSLARKARLAALGYGTRDSCRAPPLSGRTSSPIEAAGAALPTTRPPLLVGIVSAPTCPLRLGLRLRREVWIMSGSRRKPRAAWPVRGGLPRLVARARLLAVGGDPFADHAGAFGTLDGARRARGRAAHRRGRERLPRRVAVLGGAGPHPGASATRPGARVSCAAGRASAPARDA
jgi:hypothetical protein